MCLSLPHSTSNLVAITRTVYQLFPSVTIELKQYLLLFNLECRFKEPNHKYINTIVSDDVRSALTVA